MFGALRPRPGSLKHGILDRRCHGLHRILSERLISRF
jgi:hypothetical protein